MSERARDRQTYEPDRTTDDGKYPFLCGVLQAITNDLVQTIERCDQHDPWLVRRRRAELDAIRRTTDELWWTTDDLRKNMDAARIAATDEAGR